MTTKIKQLETSGMLDSLLPPITMFVILTSPTINE